MIILPLLLLVLLGLGAALIAASYFFSEKKTSPNQAAIPREKITLPDGRVLEGPDKTLGKGAFGIVSAYQLNKTPVAVKKPTGAEYNAFQEHELKLLQKANPHANIIRYITRVDFDRKVWIVMELMQGSVRDLLDKIPSLSWPTRLSIARQMLTGLVHLHNQSTSLFVKKAIVHQDLKPDNLLIDTIKDDPTIQVKIGDFGIAREVDQLTVPVIGHIGSKLHEGVAGGTQVYMAPEVVRALSGNGRVDCDPKSDLFSVGIILWELITGTRPIRTNDECLNGTFDEFNSDRNIRPTITQTTIFGGATTKKGPSTYPKSSFFGPVIDRCTQPQASKRDSAFAILRQLPQPG